MISALVLKQIATKWRQWLFPWRRLEQQSRTGLFRRVWNLSCLLLFCGAESESVSRFSRVWLLSTLSTVPCQASLFPLFPHLLASVLGPDAMILVFCMLSFKPNYSFSSLTFIKRLFSSSSLSAHKGGVICISEVIDISSGNLDSSLCFFQPSVSHDVLCIEVK